jgi:hypothetical protein
MAVLPASIAHSEMLHQSDAPYLFDSGKFAKEFGFAGTPYADGSRASAASFMRDAHGSDAPRA